MLISDLSPKTDARVKFHYSALDEAPAESGCYVITTFSGTILYIGQSVNIRNRMEQHLDGRDKEKETPQGVAYFVHYKLWEKTKLNDLERGWANSYQLKAGELPYFNKVNPPV